MMRGALLNGKTELLARRRVARNAAVLAALKLGAPLCSLLLVLAVSRALGAEGVGRYSLAYTWLALFGLLGPLGLPALVTREGARDAGSLGRLLSSGMALGGAVSAVLAVAMAGAGAALGYDAATRRALAVLGLGLVPSTWLTYFEAGFLALERTRPIALTTAVEHVVKVGGGVVLLWAGYGLDAVLAAAVAGRAAACAVAVVALGRLGTPVRPVVDAATLHSVVAQAPVLALSAICATLYWRVDVLLLAEWRDMAEVGCYTAAYRILDLAILAPQSLCQALYPGLARERRRGMTALGALLLLTAPAVLVVSPVAGSLMGWLYGRELAASGPMLAILIWTAVPYAWNRYHAYLLVAQDRQQADLAINAGMLVLNVALNLALIPRYGGAGAAAATLATTVVYGVTQWGYLRKPIAA